MAKPLFPKYPDCLQATNLTIHDLQPYADIAGIGIIVAFVSTAYFTFLLSLAYYLLVFDPEHHVVVANDSPNAQNQIDIRLLKFLRKLGTRIRRHLPLPTCTDLETVLCSSILSLCDSQLMTGMAILFSGFLSLRFGTPEGNHLSTFHWYMIVYLAWFSFVTNLSGLTIIRLHLRPRKRDRKFRIFFTIPVFLLLLIALGPTVWFNWLMDVDEAPTAAKPSSPAICYFDAAVAQKLWQRSNPSDGDEFRERWSATILGSASLQSAVTSILFILFGSLNRAIKLSETATGAAYKYLKVPLSRRFQGVYKALVTWMHGHRMLQNKPQIVDFVTLYGLACYSTLRILIDSYRSMLTEILWLLALLLWGTMTLFNIRMGLHDDHCEDTSCSGLFSEVLEGENQWTFGQTLPVLLLLTPAFNTLCLFYSNIGMRGAIPQDENRSTQSDTNVEPFGQTESSIRIPLNTIPAIGTNPPASNEQITSNPEFIHSTHDQLEEVELDLTLSHEDYKTAPWFLHVCIFAFLAWTAAFLWVMADTKIPGQYYEWVIVSILFGYGGGHFFFAVAVVPNTIVWSIIAGIQLERQGTARRTKARKTIVLIFLNLLLYVFSWVMTSLFAWNLQDMMGVLEFDTVWQIFAATIASQVVALVLTNLALCLFYLGWALYNRRESLDNARQQST